MKTTIEKIKTNARIAGVLYLVIILTGLFSELFVRSGIIVPGDATATTENIAGNTFLFRIGFFSDLIMVIADVTVALLFYLLLKSVNQGLALLAAFFRLAQATVIGLNLLNYYMPLLILGDTGSFSGFSSEQLNTLILLFLNAYSYGYLISGVFFGVSCIIFGYLIYKSIYFPKWLGLFVSAAGISYIIDSSVNFLFPEFASSSELLVMTIALISELSLCLYLLVKGIKSIPAVSPSS
ncbi:DUF4386 domain-containing protein [Maribellus sp. CM-23]|uniref:DUF4386 domain-containing protein n=1 Tax=Maribellus sp. CM-23 TaxID=2781026 RepID=UPI001F422886|nr:DUF4386 domain-containing protein [Maribellus sp. CM-23]MCE4564584.1 DUF4386 domain-containing protein [Maribellus sp. CM-23]